MLHCYSVPMLASLSHKLASFLLTHWFAVQELSSSVHGGVATVWKKGNIQFYGTIAILKNYLMNVLQIFPLKEKERCKQTKFLPIYNSITLYAMNINSKACTILSIYTVSIHRTKGIDTTT